MNEKEIEMLIEKYEAGASTLHEEQFLFDNAENSHSISEVWSTFVKRNRIEAPEDFNDKLWKSFQKRNVSKHRYKISIVSVAASIILIIALSIGNFGQNELSYKEKEALLNEALDMFVEPEHEVTQERILYEDEIIIIYASLE